MDLVGLITKTFLGLAPIATPPAAPARPAIVLTAPLAAAPTATAPAPAAAPVSAASVVDKVQAFYAGINQVTALFRQSVTYDTFGSTKTSDGKMWLQKPGKMRWDYYKKRRGKVDINKSFISNGAYLYMVEHDNKQVVKKNLQNDLMPVAVSFLYGKGDLKAEFNPELDTSKKYGGAGELVLKLTPKQPSAQYKHLFLVVNPENYRVTQSIIIDSSNNVNHFRFFAPDFKTPIDAKKNFEFDEKSVRNYRMVDADQQQAGSGTTLAP